jgi:hypothetical protein
VKRERHGGFGFFPKISTPVEKTVEKRILSSAVAQKTRFLTISQ